MEEVADLYSMGDKDINPERWPPRDGMNFERPFTEGRQPASL